MYLTQFELNPARRGSKKLLGSPQAMHAAVLAGFPSARNDSAGRVLWRVDRAGPHCWLYIVSGDEPDLAHLVEQAGWPSFDTARTRPYGRLLDSLEPGMRWGFRLTANPTRSTRIGTATRSQRVGHVTVEQQLNWFLERAPSWGITLPKTDTGPAVVVRDRQTRVFSKAGQRVTLAMATFDGELVVEEPRRLREVLTTGIGPAKAYGCGLMTLAPLREAR